MPAEEQRIDRRRARTRAALVQAGVTLFSARSVEGVAIDDIVAAADVAKGSFYNHFPDKEALVRVVTGDIRAGIERGVARANQGIEDPARRVARAVCVYLRYALDEPERARVLVRMQGGHTSLNAPLNQGLVEDVSAGLASGRFAIPTTEAGVLHILGVGQIALARLVQEPSPPLAVSLAQQMCAMLLLGFGTPAAEAGLIAAQAADEVVRRGLFSDATFGA